MQTNKPCTKCNKSLPIANKKYNLCFDCNFKRLHNGLSPRQYYYVKQKESSLKRFKKTKNDIEKMEEVYEQVFNNKPPFCEECRKPLSKIFRNSKGKVVDKFRFSHILPKSIYSKYKYNSLNFNLLCFDCHATWENGSRHSMRIWKQNIQIPEIGEIVLNNR